MKLFRSIYGLKQAPLLFNRHLDGTLKSFGFLRSKHDPCVYFKRGESTEFIIIAIVVDDMLCAASSQELIASFRANLTAVYNITDLGPPARLVGININLSPNRIELNQPISVYP